MMLDAVADGAGGEPSVERAASDLGSAYRWVVLAIMSLICLAAYYIYDSVTPVGTLIKSELDLSGAEYGLLFSFYSVGNVFLLLVLVGGVLVDRLGLRAAGILYGSMCLVGAALTAAGGSGALPALLGGGYERVRAALAPHASPELGLMLAGRMIYGVGTECILLVNNKVLARWFRGRELAFAYGLNLTIMRLGTFLALNLQAPAADWLGLRGALWFAVAVMAAGFSTFFVYLGLERKARGRQGAPDTGEGSEVAPLERFVLREAFSFKASFWVISALSVAFYSAVFPFQAYAPDILVQRFGYSVAGAGHVTSALILGSMVCTPILGWYVDRRGRRATLMIAGSLLLVPCHLLIGYTSVPPVIPIFLVGVALSLVPAALWAAIPMMVSESRLGTAFGVIGYVQNVGLMLFPYLAGKIADAHTVAGSGGQPVVDYAPTMLMFAALGLVGLMLAVVLKVADSRRREGPSIEDVLLR